VTKRRAAILAVFLLVLATFLGFITWNVYDNARFESQAKSIVKEVTVLNGGKVIAFDVNYEGLLFRKINSILVTISENGVSSGISDQIKGLIKAETGQAVSVRLSFVQVQESGEG
jgi:hypothetical protein